MRVRSVKKQSVFQNRSNNLLSLKQRYFFISPNDPSSSSIIRFISERHHSSQKISGSVLVYDFWTPSPPPPTNFVHDLDFNYFQQQKTLILYYFMVRLGQFLGQALGQARSDRTDL